MGLRCGTLVTNVRTMAPATQSRVLLVEDYADAREMYAEYLARAGFKIIEAADGEEGLNTALEAVPDLIVLDIGLPKIDGLTVARRLRAEAATARVPIIALSANTLLHFAPLALEAGCSVAMSKPCLPEELLLAIRGLLETG